MEIYTPEDGLPRSPYSPSGELTISRNHRYFLSNRYIIKVVCPELYSYYPEILVVVFDWSPKRKGEALPLLVKELHGQPQTLIHNRNKGNFFFINT